MSAFLSIYIWIVIAVFSGLGWLLLNYGHELRRRTGVMAFLVVFLAFGGAGMAALWAYTRYVHSQGAEPGIRITVERVAQSAAYVRQPDLRQPPIARRLVLSVGSVLLWLLCFARALRLLRLGLRRRANRWAYSSIGFLSAGLLLLLLTGWRGTWGWWL